MEASGEDFMADLLASELDNDIKEDLSTLQTLENEAELSVQAYRRNRGKKWYVFLTGLILGGLIGFGAPKIYRMVSSARYYRDSLDKIANEYFHNMTFDQMLGDTLVVAFDYNTFQPRFYSKYFLKQDPGIYGVYTR